MSEEIEKKRKGFSAMPTELHRALASQGGKAAHANGKGHKWNQETARAAGHKGGTKTAQNIEHMREIGRRGGAKRWVKHTKGVVNGTDSNGT